MNADQFPVRRPLAVAWSQVIAEQRAALGLTQAHVAGECGVEQATVSKWEAGKVIPSAEAQAKLVKVLGIPPDRWYRIQQQGVPA